MSCYNLLRNFLFKLDAEKSHTLGLMGLNILYKLKLSNFFFKSSLLNNKIKKNSISKSPITLFGLNFKNKIGLAAGLDKNGDYIDALGSLGFSFIEIGTVTPKSQVGNTKPRLWRIVEKKSIINRMGFNNKGVDALIENVKKSTWVKNGGIIGINIGKNSNTPLENATQDYLICLNKVYNYASYIVINISSPNTSGLRSLQSGELFNNLLSEIKTAQTDLTIKFDKYVPILIKIAPDLSLEEIKFIANSLIKFSFDGVIATNTTIDKSSLSKHEKYEGGLSGALLKQKSNLVLQSLAQKLEGKIPIIGVGGVISFADAKYKLSLGADLVQIYSGFIYVGPKLVQECINNL